MKTIFKFMLLTLIFVCSAFAQSDSVINTKGADFSLYRTSFVKYGDSKNVEKEREIFEVENINTVVFLRKDSLVLMNDNHNWFSSSLKDIDKIILKTGNISPVFGIVPGAIIGGLVGGFIYSLSLNEKSIDIGEGVLVAAVFLKPAFVSGVLLGGIIGYYIINAINHETLDLFSVHDKDKKDKLIKFLRQKR